VIAPARDWGVWHVWPCKHSEKEDAIALRGKFSAMIGDCSRTTQFPIIASQADTEIVQ
jgi:hypothetical protein